MTRLKESWNMKSILKGTGFQRIFAACLSTLALLIPTVIWKIFNLGVLVLAVLTLLLWGRIITAAGHGPRWLGMACKWLCRIGWSFFLGCCVIMYIFTWANALPADAGPCVIVVPGAQIVEDSPSIMLRNRLNRALELWQSHPGSAIVVTGGKTDVEQYSEAEVMALYLTRHGVDSSDIYLENQAANTQENFMLSAQLIRQNGLEGPVVIATDAFHQTRCRLWAKKVGFEKVYSAICFPSWSIAPVYWLREVCGVAHFYMF